MRLHQLFTPGALSLLLLIAGCTESVGPGQIGGDTDLELTEVGNEFPMTIETDSFIPGLDGYDEKVVITARDEGIVTFSGHVEFDSLFVEALDSALGTSGMPDAAKLAALDVYLDRYGVTIDTTDKDAMTADVEIKARITSEGIQEFATSGTMERPFTIVEYDADVGDSWSFTTDDGRTITRKVTRRSTEDDYPVAFWLIKVIEVEETSDDPLVEKITYYANHKFGMVGVEMIMENGKTIGVGILPPNL